MRQIIDGERIALLRKYEKAAGYSFPSFNAQPLWRFPSEITKECAVKFRKALASKQRLTIDKIQEEIRSFLDQGVSLWKNVDKSERGRDEMDKVNGCLCSVTKELSLISENNVTLRPLTTLLDRALQLNGELLHQKLSDWLLLQFQTPSNDLVNWFDLLFFHSGKTPKSSSFVFELADQSSFDYPINHPQTYQWLNDAMFQSEVAGAKPSVLIASDVRDAFGTNEIGIDESFPEVKMSRFGKINLRAMSSESPCQKRYGVADAKSFPVSKSARQSMKNALEWISRDERQGKTWSDLTSENGVATVLFCYPSKLTEDPPYFAYLATGENGASPLTIKAEFLACAESIARALSGRHSITDPINIEIFVLSKPDGFRSKVLYSASYNATSIIDSAKDWISGCQNLPHILVRQFSDYKAAHPEIRELVIPFPTQIIGCVNSVWQRMGTHVTPSRSIQISDSLSLLLDQGHALQMTSSRILEWIIKNSIGLLLATGQSNARGRVHAVAKNLQKYQLMLPSLLGLLLWKLGIQREAYMKTATFLVGRMLNVADQLHLQYCSEVRKNDVPPQLIGNAMMSVALANPENALALLAERMKPYLAWAQTVQSGSKVGLTKYFLRQLGEIASKLSELELPTRCTDSDRATMLLGYLSRPEKEIETNEEETK